MLANGELHHLTGFENDWKDGTGFGFNFLLSNGDRSKQRDKKYPTNFTHMMPEGSHNKIRSVRIYHDGHFINGFSFFDKEEALLWMIGRTNRSYFEVDTVLIDENEVIIGVVAKLYSGWQSVYTDW